MSSIVTELSLGKLADRVARAIGWSPIGRQLRLTNAEGPRADWLEGRSVRVVSMSGHDLIVEAGPSTVDGERADANLRLTPRHIGWTAHSLMWVGIAAVVSVEGSGGTSESIAIVTARLDRAMR